MDRGDQYYLPYLRYFRNNGDVTPMRFAQEYTSTDMPHGNVIEHMVDRGLIEVRDIRVRKADGEQHVEKRIYITQLAVEMLQKYT